MALGNAAGRAGAGISLLNPGDIGPAPVGASRRRAGGSSGTSSRSFPLPHTHRPHREPGRGQLPAEGWLLPAAALIPPGEDKSGQLAWK